MVDGVRRFMDSTRAELMGVLAAMGGVRGYWRGRVVHRLDNQGVVDAFERRRRVRRREEDGAEGWEEVHGDLWMEVEKQMEWWGDRYELRWSQGHPERGKKGHEGKGTAEGREGWSVHDHYNHACDEEAESVYDEECEWGQTRGHGEGGIEVWVGGERLQQKVRNQVKAGFVF